MHNNIMAAGSKERPPMLGPGRYSQWHSRFLRYLDTKSNGEYLRKCIFDGPYMPTNVLIAAVEAAENILPVAAHEEVETIHNMTAENKLYFQAEKEAIFLILTGGTLQVSTNATRDVQFLQQLQPGMVKICGRMSSRGQEMDTIAEIKSLALLAAAKTIFRTGLPENPVPSGQPLEQVDQNAAECVDERVALANLIANLTLDTEEKTTLLKAIKESDAYH
ncbi:hypothetical protein Tco_1507170 [Tanacetum coccineum]